MKTEEFFEAVYQCRLSDLDTFNHIQNITGDYDEDKLNLLCNDFDFYLFMKTEEVYNFTIEEIENKIEEFHKDGIKIPKLSDRNFLLTYVSEYFKTPENKKLIKERTPEQKANLNKFLKDWEQSKKNIIDTQRLMDFHEVELFSLYKLRNLLVDLKRKHTSAVYKFDDKLQAKNENSEATNTSISPQLYQWILNNPELAEKFYPDERKTVSEWLNESPGYIKANYIQSMPKHFQRWRKNIDKSELKSVKEKKIEKYLKHIEMISYWYGYRESEFVSKNGIEFEAFKSVENELDEMREYLISIQTSKLEDKSIFQNVDSKHINWLKSDESLEQFIEALKEQNLIKAKETEAIIKEHFEAQIEQNTEPEPIQWLESIALLTYMIEQLNKRIDQYINPENLWHDTAPHFSVNGKTPKNLRQTSNRFKQNKTGKPKNYKTIDSIIKSLSA